MIKRKLNLTIISLVLLLPACSQKVEGISSGQKQLPDMEISDVNSRNSKDGWQLEWSDEFSGNKIDDSKWSFNIDCWGGGNNERQCYTNSPRNASIEEGKLVITARRERTTGPALPPYLAVKSQNPKQTKEQDYSSARLVTKGKASWLYGRIDVRVKLPQGQGTWPAIWMLPEDNDYGKWAASGEIDILEAVNLGVACKTCPDGKENTILGTLHFGGVWPENKLASTEIPLPGSLDEFHTYSIIWNKGQFVWFVDGKAFAMKQAKDWSTTASDGENAPFDRAFHLILNLAIGGGLAEERGEGGVSMKDFPKRFEIDFVRVWKCKGNNDNKLNCMNGTEK